MKRPTTTNLTEGTNLYYTDTRFDTRLSSKDTGDLTEGFKLIFTNARADARITAVGSRKLEHSIWLGRSGAAGYQTTAGLNGAIDTHLNQPNPNKWLRPSGMDLIMLGYPMQDIPIPDVDAHLNPIAIPTS